MKVLKPACVFFGTLLALMLVIRVSLNLFNLEPMDLEQANLKVSLLPVRVGFYLLVIAAWQPIARFLSRPQRTADGRAVDVSKQWDELTTLLVKSRWKVALFFVCFELIAIQQVGV